MSDEETCKDIQLAFLMLFLLALVVFALFYFITL